VTVQVVQVVQRRCKGKGAEVVRGAKAKVQKSRGAETRSRYKVQRCKAQSESCRRGAEVLSRCRGSRMVMVIGGAQ